MIAELEITNAEIAQHVWSLQRASYQVEADLIGFDQIPPLRETLAELQQCGETFYGYLIDGVIAGAISFRRDEETLDIHRMMVHPEYFRQGIAGALLNYVLQIPPTPTKVVVSTGADNHPAIRLYEKHGFIRLGNVEVAPGFFIVQFCNEKQSFKNGEVKQVPRPIPRSDPKEL